MSQKKTVLGIDEAGRGPVIGSMFVGGFKVDEDKLEELEELGVKDSKKLSDKKRERLAEKLPELGEVILKEVTASEIDELREVMTLNEIEIQGFIDVIKKSDADIIYLDLPEPNAERFVNKLKAELPEKYADRKFVAEHGADDEYPVVSAASIMAKSAREEHVKELHRKYGYDFKSGYPHDQPTREFLKEYAEEKGELPKETRRSWSTADKILNQLDQTDLGNF